MDNVAKVVDGKLDYDYTDSSKKKQEALGSKLGYDQFLQLLCAEMQYQDPLEPTSNTEYVAQLATFSQVEATLAIQNSQQSQMANALVGKTVILKTTNENTGATSYVDGKVDYVLYEEKDTYLSVNNKLYPISELDTVADNDYYEAMGIAKSIENMLSKLPSLDNTTEKHADMLKQITDIYDGMTDYQKKYVSDKTLQTLGAYRTKVNEAVKRAQEAAASTVNTEQTDEESNTTDTQGEGITTV